MINRLIRPEILALKAYAVPDPDKLTKLDAMENPYHWPREMVRQWQQELENAPLNRYPDPEASSLKQSLRVNMGVPDGMDILLGNGSDEIIQIILMAVSGAGRKVMSLSPSFVMYDMITTFTGMQFIDVPLRADFEIDIDQTRKALQQHEPAVTFIAYPNNPTGNLFEREHVETIINESKGVVVLDEAYHAFSDDSFMQDLDRFDNLLVMRTVSKMGLAGLRLGLLAGSNQWLSQFNKIRLPYNINVLTQLSADFALRHSDILAQQAADIRRDREQLYSDLCKIETISVFPSKANFILFRVPPGSATVIFESIRQQGILIKNLGARTGPLQDCLRVTVGTPDENRRFLQALVQALQAHAHS